MDDSLNTDLKYLDRRATGRRSIGPRSMGNARFRKTTVSLFALAYFLASFWAGFWAGRMPQQDVSPPSSPSSQAATWQNERSPAAENAVLPTPTSDTPTPGRQIESKGSTRMEFEFYTLLPGREVKVPSWQTGKNPEVPARKQEQGERERPTTQRGSSYILQAGSFRLLEEAERHCRRLAEFGVTAEIQAVHLEAGGRWHRVRIGPRTDAAELQALQARLRRNGLHSMLLRLLPPATPTAPLAPSATHSTKPAPGSGDPRIGDTWSGDTWSG